MAVGIRTKRRPAPRRGPTDSNDYDAFQDEVATDLANMAAEINALTAELSRVHLIRFHETAALRAQIDELRRNRVIRNQFAAASGEAIISSIDFRGFSGVDYEISYAGLAEGRRARVEPAYGQVLLPYNNVVNRVYGLNPDTGEVVLPGTLEISVTGYNESGGTVTAGTTKYAVNGNNQEYWVRSVRFPMEDDVDYVEADFQLNLPQKYTTHVNLVSVHPFPLGELDVLNVLYSSTTADPAIALPGFTAVNNAGFLRWHFADLNMTKIRVRLRQRHFVEENGFKVFYIGLQELLLHLVEFDKTANPAAGPLDPLDGNGLVVRIDAPTDYEFNLITNFLCSPGYAVPASDNKIYYRIYSDQGLTGLLWNSWTDPTPSAVPVDLSALGLSSIYVSLTMEWDDVNLVSPVVENFGLQYSVTHA